MECRTGFYFPIGAHVVHLFRESLTAGLALAALVGGLRPKPVLSVRVGVPHRATFVLNMHVFQAMT